MTYEELIDSLQNLLTEGEFTARWTLIQTYHSAGLLINEYAQDRGDKTKLLKDIAVRLKKNERTLWNAAAFAQRFPVLAQLPDGKNVSWNLLVTKYLTGPKELPEHDHEYILLCKICKQPQEK